MEPVTHENSMRKRNPDFTVRHCKRLLEEKKIETAIQYCETHLKYDPESKKVTLYLAQIYSSIKDYENAKRVLQTYKDTYLIGEKDRIIDDTLTYLDELIGEVKQSEIVIPPPPIPGAQKIKIYTQSGSDDVTDEEIKILFNGLTAEQKENSQPLVDRILNRYKKEPSNQILALLLVFIFLSIGSKKRANKVIASVSEDPTADDRIKKEMRKLAQSLNISKDVESSLSHIRGMVM